MLAQDGKCVLCRRAQPRFRLVERQGNSLADGFLTGLLGLGLVSALGTLLWTARVPAPSSAERPGAQAAAIVADSDPVDLPLTIAREPEAHASAEGPARGATRDTRNQDTRNQDNRDQERATAQARVKRELRAARAAVEDAKRAVPIVMYSTSWCTICETSRYYMLGRELSFTEHDIEQDPRAEKRLAGMNPARSVPTFVVDGEVLVGFNAWQLEGALEDAAKQRVGATCNHNARCQ